MEIGKTYKFLSGPYKGLVFTLQGKDEKLGIWHIKLAQYDRKDAISLELVTQWGTAEV